MRRIALIAAALLAALPAAASARNVNADPFTLATPPLHRGQFELLTVSTLPAAVTGDEVLMQVRGLGPRDRVAVRVGRRSVTRAFSLVRPGVLQGLVAGLRLGRNRVQAVARGPGGRRVATLTVVDHPISGPVLSGPHQTPFYCETEKAGLGKPLDANCSAKTRYQWFYRSAQDQKFHELANPYAAYPSDVDTTTTSTGQRVPFVVRIESATINRGITRIAVLDDPHARGPDKPFRPTEWDRVITHAFGESCSSGFHQGVNSPDSVLGGIPASPGADNIFSTVYGLTQRLGEGDLVVHSTMTTYGVYCNPLVSGETAMMVKEHVVDNYGIPEREVGVGGSGGALQQYNAANNFPGVLDGADPIATFTDIPSTAMTVVDCGLLTHYWDSAAGSWSDAQKEAVAGERTTSICKDWVSEFLPLLDPHKGCDSIVPENIRYDARTNPHGLRCSLQDALKNLLGVDPRTGFAYRPYDNVGVQYGLAALNAGTISFDQFVDLNQKVGGYDADAAWQGGRDAVPTAAVQRLYELGLVVGRGSLDRIPIIDSATYLDLVPSADIHDDIRPFQVRARLQKWSGTDGTQQIWRGFSVPNDTRPALNQWMDAIDQRHGLGDPAAVAAARPAAADDRCIVSPGGASVTPFSQVVGPLGIVAASTGAPAVAGRIPVGADVPERQEPTGNGLCQSVFTAYSDPRMVAGGPLSDDVVKCSLKPIDPGDYAMALTAQQLAQLRAIFPDGVCDWSRPGPGELAHSLTFPSVGGARLERPHSLRWTVAVSSRVRHRR